MILNTVEQTRQMGEYLGRCLKTFDTIALIGDLGSGKTTLTQALAKGMGIEEVVSSATFTLVNIYKGAIPLYHFDAYRLNNIDEFYDIGGEDYLNQEGVFVIEWADLIEEALPQDHLRLTWTRNPQGQRQVQVEARGKRSQELKEELKKFEDTCL